MKIAMKIRIKVAEGEIGDPRGGSIPLVIKPADREFMGQFFAKELHIVGDIFDVNMAMVVLLGDKTRAVVALDLGDPDTRDMLASWRNHGIHIELRQGDDALTIRHIEWAADLESLLTLEAYPWPNAFLTLTSYPWFPAKLSAAPMLGQELPAPSFLFSAALSESHRQAIVKLRAVNQL